MSFCGYCGAPRASTTEFCGICGGDLARLDADIAKFKAQNVHADTERTMRAGHSTNKLHQQPAAMTTPPSDDSPTLPLPDQDVSDEPSATSRVAAFWTRHLVLNIATIAAAACWAFYWGSSGDSFALLALLISVSLVPSWWIALTGPGELPGFVDFADRWYAKLHGFVSNRQGNMVRLFLVPIVWIGARWAKFADNREDTVVAASLRIFGYVLAIILLIAMVAITVYLVVAIVIFLLMVAAALWIMGLMLGAGDDDRDRPIRKPFIGGPRGSKVYRDGGGIFDTAEQIGRIGSDGQIYEDDGSLLGVSKRVGRIDDKGRIFEGSGGIFDTDQQVGKIDGQGRVYSDDGSILGTPERIGKIDRGGRMHSGGGGLFDTDRQVGKIKPDK